MITIIDVGQPIFLFFVGFSGYIAFSSRLKKTGVLGAWRYGGVRIALLYALSAIGKIINDPPREEHASWAQYFSGFNWYAVLSVDVLAIIAVGCIGTYVAITFFRKALHRVMLALGIFIAHAFVYALYWTDRHTGMDYMLGLPEFPILTLALMGLSILGSGFGQWVHESREDVGSALRERIVPWSCGCLMVSFLLEWVQPSEHHDGTMALMLLAAGLSGLLVTVLYCMEQVGIMLVTLRALGRNLLLVFIIGAVLFEIYLDAIPDIWIQNYPLAAMVCIGFIPIFSVVLVTRVLERYNIVFRV